MFTEWTIVLYPRRWILPRSCARSFRYVVLYVFMVMFRKVLRWGRLGQTRTRQKDQVGDIILLCKLMNILFDNRCGITHGLLKKRYQTLLRYLILDCAKTPKMK